MTRRPSFLLCAACLASACTPNPPPSFPTGAGDPFPDAAAAYGQAIASCRDVKTLTASMALSGKAGRTSVRGRIDAGFETPARMRLEGRAAFGRAVFVLTADGDRATLVLPRDERVLANAPPDQIVEALAGVPLGSDALRTVVSGCGLSIANTPADGRLYADGLAAVSLGNATTYLRRIGAAWQVTGAMRDSLTVFYSDVVNGRPSAIRLRAIASGRVAADLTLQLSQVEINKPLDPRAFKAEIPEHAAPLTLDELRRAGPLGTQEGTKGTEEMEDPKGMRETKGTEKTTGIEETKGTD
jgi:outer membrane lipoprotein-sorting protein